MEESALYSDLLSQSNVTQWFHQKDLSLMAEKKRDCVIAAHACLESEHCTVLYENFKKTCGRETELCKTLDGSQLCTTLRENLKGTILGNCQCSDPSKTDCIKIWKSLFEDVCIQDTQINQVAAFSEDYEDGFNQDIVSGWYSNKFRNTKYNHIYELTREYLVYNFNSALLAVFLLGN